MVLGQCPVTTFMMQGEQSPCVGMNRKKQDFKQFCWSVGVLRLEYFTVQLPRSQIKWLHYFSPPSIME